MDKNTFKFKQFEVDQTGCAMRVNTDGVLLAALANGDEFEHILDIGTGTGVMALMLGQRYPHAKIHAVEIDAAAAKTAERNFRNSPFQNRLSISHTAIEQYATLQQFDLIISNPPYFINDLRSAEERKGIARHANIQFFKDLAIKIDELLSPSGYFWFILPIKQAELLINEASVYGLSISKQIILYSDQSKPPFRWLIGLTRFKNEAEITHFYIYETEKVYTDAYKKLLKDFFLGY